MNNAKQWRLQDKPCHPAGLILYFGYVIFWNILNFIPEDD